MPTPQDWIIYFLEIPYAHIKPSLRGLPLNGYVILYQVIDDGVKILRVVNGRQDLESLFADWDDE